MTRQKRYIETDVLTEAKRRIEHTLDIFDTLVVMFSGGKDSLTVLNLVHEVYQEHGITEPVNVVFRDEELIGQDVIDFVDSYRRRPWVKMLWFAVPLGSSKHILGQTFDYVQWDEGRTWVRSKPAWAITGEPGMAPLSQYSADAYIGRYFKGKKAYLTGVRADESIVRYRSVVDKLSENYIVKPVTYGEATAPADIMLVKPVYDWTENDIFKYLGERGIEWCSIYDHEMWAGVNLRVSTPLHAEAAKRFDRLKTFEPELYQAIIDVFPEMLAHERYGHDIDRDAIKERYGLSIAGIRAWIDDNITDEHQLALARARLDSVAVRARNMPDSYPMDYLFGAFMAGGYKREILPVARRAT